MVERGSVGLEERGLMEAVIFWELLLLLLLWYILGVMVVSCSVSLYPVTLTSPIIPSLTSTLPTTSPSHLNVTVTAWKTFVSIIALVPNTSPQIRNRGSMSPPGVVALVTIAMSGNWGKVYDVGVVAFWVESRDRVVSTVWRSCGEERVSGLRVEDEIGVVVVKVRKIVVMMRMRGEG